MFIFSQVTTNLMTGVLIGAVCVFAFVIVILVLSLRYARASRELLHAERIRAVEAGLPWEEPESTKAGAKFMHNAFWISFWIVVGVPGAGFSAASAVTTEIHIAIGVAAWSAAAVASVAAVVCATTLMIYARSRQQPRDIYSAKHRNPT